MRKSIIILSCLLLTALSARAQVVESYDLLRTNSWSIYGQAGLSMAQGNQLYKNVNAQNYVHFAPMGGIGLTFNAKPWMRFNLDYELSKYRRQQCFDQIQKDGLAYRNLESLYHTLELNYDINITELFNRDRKRFNIYFGAGIGGALVTGNDYTITIQDPTINPSMGSDYTFNTKILAHNEHVNEGSLYIPANLSLEYDVMPRLTVGLRGSAKVFLNRDAKLVPSTTEAVGVVLRVNLFNASRHGYTSRAKQIRSLNNKIRTKTRTIDRLNEDIEERDETINGLQGKVNQLEKNLDNCNSKLNAKKTEKFIVYFDHDSYALDIAARATINSAARYLINEPDASAIITASCSTLGTEAYNQKLSEQRAEAVREALIAAGVVSSQISDVKAIGKSGMDSTDASRRAIIDVEN